MRTHHAQVCARRRYSAWPWRLAGVSLFLLLSCLLVWETTLAQASRPFLIPRPEFLIPDQGGPAAEESGAEPAVTAAHARPKQKLIVDTDAGVDDAAAIAWLLTQTRYPVEVVGFAAVAGNTTVENVANNLLVLEAVTGRTDIPVTIGSAVPLVATLSSTGKLIHGPDGLWFQGFFNPQDIAALPGYADSQAVVDFYCDTLDKQNITIVALGSQTNLARAIADCPDDMADYGAMVAIGGARYGGNQIPNAEYNFWQDPDAAAALLQYVAPAPGPGEAPQIPVSIVPLDAFSQLIFSLKDVEKLANKKSPVGQFLAPILGSYICAKNNLPPFPYSSCLDALPAGTAAKDVKGAIPDIAATMYALNRKLGTEQSALVKVMTPVDPALRLVRGQSIIGLAFQERVTMIADDTELSAIADCAFAPAGTCPGFDFNAAVGAILAREPDNVAVVTAIDARKMQNDFLKDLTAKPAKAASVDGALEGEASAEDGADPTMNQHLYLPLVSDE